MTALDARDHLKQLHAERAEALAVGLLDNDAYVADLEEEIAAWRHAYVGAGVIEIATLRGELFGIESG
jgi:hypothetical protein